MGKINFITPLYGDERSTKEILFKQYSKKILKRADFTNQDTRKEIPNFKNMIDKKPVFYVRLDGTPITDFLDTINGSVDRALLVGLLSPLRQSFVREYYETHNLSYASLFTTGDFKEFIKDNNTKYDDKKVSLYLETDISYNDTNRVGELIKLISETFKETYRLTIYVSLIK